MKLPTSAELRAYADVLGIDYSTVNFRSSTQRKALYDQIQQTKAVSSPVDESSELQRLREENQRLRDANAVLEQENQRLTKENQKLELKTQTQQHFLDMQDKSLRKQGSRGYVPYEKHALEMLEQDAEDDKLFAAVLGKSPETKKVVSINQKRKTND